jgi:hypothetical protein
LEQRDPVRFGRKKLYLSTVGTGWITEVRVNGQEWKTFDLDSVFLPYAQTPETARVQIMFGGTQPTRESEVPKEARQPSMEIERGRLSPELSALDKRAVRLRNFSERLAKAGLDESYEAAHARLALRCIAIIHIRQQLQRDGQIASLPGVSQVAADKSYVDTAVKICDGLEKVLDSYKIANDSNQQKIHRLWTVFVR